MYFYFQIFCWLVFSIFPFSFSLFGVFKVILLVKRASCCCCWCWYWYCCCYCA